MSNRTYKLHLDGDMLDILNRVLDNHDWFCNCPDYPECDDFKKFQKLKKRAATLEERSLKQRFNGKRGQFAVYAKGQDKAYRAGLKEGVAIGQNRH